jgi:hypothetical protein
VDARALPAASELRPPAAPARRARRGIGRQRFTRPPRKVKRTAALSTQLLDLAAATARDAEIPDGSEELPSGRALR